MEGTMSKKDESIEKKQALLMMKYSEIIQGDIDLTTLGVNQELEFVITKMILKITKVPKIDKDGKQVDGFNEKINTILYNHDEECISSLSNSLARFGMNLVKSLNHELSAIGYIELDGLNIPIIIKKFMKNSKNYYNVKVTAMDWGNIEKKVLSLDIIKSSMNNVLLIET